MSFGFSVGDFVACMLLINDVAQALQSSTGSVSEVKNLVGQLDSLMLALMSSASIHQQINGIELGPEFKAAAGAMSNGIQMEYERCKDALQAFKDSLKPYTDAFVAGKASALTRHVRKITWLFRNDDIAKLEKRLEAHLRSLNMYKTALSEIYAATTANNSVEVLSSIADLRIEVNKISKSIVRQHSQIPRNLGYSWEANFTPADTIILLDAIGRVVILPLVLLGSANDLREILMVMYRTIEIGRRKILRNEYTITDESSDGTLLDATNWATAVQPGIQLTLNMVFPATESFNDKVCPRCDEQTLGMMLSGQRRRCHKCQLTFRVFDKERFVEQSDFDNDSSSAPITETSLVANIHSSAPSELDSRKRKKPSTCASAESLMFRSVHYHRDIRIAKSASGEPEDSDSPPELDVEELPPLHKAAAKGNLHEIDELLTGGANINDPLPFQAQEIGTGDWYFGPWKFKGCSPLLIACWYGAVRSINHLLDRGANILGVDAAGQGTFQYASYSPNPERIFPILIRRGANHASADKYGCTAFHECCWIGLAWSVQFFLDHGMDLECKNEHGLTPLSFGVIGNSPQVVEVLIDCGASVNVWDVWDGSSTLHSAARGGSLRITQILLELGHDPSPQDEEGNTPLHNASFHGHIGIVDLLLANGAVPSSSNELGETAMHHAVWNGHETVVERFMEHSNDTNTCDIFGMKPWHLAAHQGHRSLVERFIKAGVELQSRGEDESTALHLASSRGHEDLVLLLLENGADIHSRDVKGRTALHLACTRGYVEVVKYLLLQEADPEAIDNHGYTALLSAAFYDQNDTVKLLLHHGAKCSTASPDGYTPLMRASDRGNISLVKMLLDSGAATVAANDVGWQALHLAVMSGHDQVVGLLLDQGAEIDAIDSHGRTALHMACFRGHEKIVDLLLKWGARTLVDHEGRSALHDAGYKGNEANIIALLGHGLDPNCRLTDGKTTLHWAAIKGNAKAVQLLIEAGANLNMEDSKGRTALHFAFLQRNDSIARMLLEAGCDLSRKHFIGTS
ncbi:hypothetical protein ONS95_002125 [Cadophora gregata]|uniref:uncharacterized protein n=1 Tax=Cadophora gregata TaxID=51156 RepID=UPI0026DD2D32|nr:uncharacterized protein ONS95_002125 [Cadophora gregata]KAK0109431.1 hypothetical protein ONS95_002125 [Cadophora gregata]KAK0110939.1 hypothetical protein ONS96_002526 [Cadophora gregata f. sp. sojae]